MRLAGRCKQAAARERENEGEQAEGCLWLLSGEGFPKEDDASHNGNDIRKHGENWHHDDAPAILQG